MITVKLLLISLIFLSISIYSNLKHRIKLFYISMSFSIIVQILVIISICYVNYKFVD